MSAGCAEGIEPSPRDSRRSKPGDRTLHVRRMKPISPPGELLAALAGRRGVEPRWSDLETNPIPDRSLCLRDSGRTRTAILRFGISDPDPLEDGALRSGVVYGSRTRVTGLRARFPGRLEEHDLVRTAGIEPAISGRSRRHSPAELRAHRRALGRNRTDARGLRGCDTTFVLRGHTWSGRQGSNLPGLRRERSAAPSGLVRIVPPAGLEPTHCRVRTGCSTLELRRQGSRGLERLARRRDSVVTPRHTVSLAFRCELVLGDPSIHLCFSRPQFGLRDSNSHIQVQSLASCRWTKPDCRRSGESRTLTSRSKNPVRCQLRHRPRSAQ